MTQIAALQWEEIPITRSIDNTTNDDIRNNSDTRSDAASKLILNMKNHAAVHHHDTIYVIGGNFQERMDVVLYHIPTQKWSRVLYSNERELDDMHQNPNRAIGGGGTRRFRFLNGRSASRTMRSDSAGTTRRQEQQQRQGGGGGDEVGSENERGVVTMTGPRPHFRNGHTATLVQKTVGGSNMERHYIYIIGGWLGDCASDQVLVLDITNPQLLEWVSFPESGTPPGPCNMHSAEYIPDRKQIFVFRGGDGSEYLNDLHALNVDTMKWQKVDTYGLPPERRADHASAYMHSTKEFFVFGGWNGTTRLNDFYILDTVTLTWTRPKLVQGTMPPARAGMTMSAVKDRLYLFGGNGTESSISNELHVFDRSSMEWLESDGTNLLLSTSQHSHVSLLSEDDSGDTRTSDMGFQHHWNHNPNSMEKLSQISIHGCQPSRRAGHSATVVGRFIYIIGGSFGSQYRNDCHVLDTDNLCLPPESESNTFQMMHLQLKDHFNQKDLADVIFLVEGKPIYAHKLVLCLSSQVYRAMFLNEFKEKKEHRVEIKVPNYSHDVFLLVLQYMYTGDIDLSLQEATVRGASESIERIVAILELADHLLLDHLKERCERALMHAVNVTSIEFLMQFAQHSNAKCLEAICCHFMRNHNFSSS
jgi:hypothetical protein